jgi:hypothetical protein
VVICGCNNVSNQSKCVNELENVIGTYKVNYAGKLIHQIQLQVK